MGIPRIQDLPGIAGAYGGDLVGGFNGALHHIHAAVILQQSGVIQGNAHQLVEHFLAVLALVLDVVDGEYGMDVLIALLILVENLVVHRDHGSLPVVGVNDVRLEVDTADHFQHCTAVEYKPLTVIIEAVDAVSAEVVLIVDKIIGHTLVNAGENAAVLLPPGNVHGNIGQKGQRSTHFRRNALVQGDHDQTVMSLFHNSGGQRAGNIRQTAGRYIGQCLTGCKQNIHTDHPSCN